MFILSFQESCKSPSLNVVYNFLVRCARVWGPSPSKGVEAGFSLVQSHLEPAVAVELSTFRCPTMQVERASDHVRDAIAKRGVARGLHQTSFSVASADEVKYPSPASLLPRQGISVRGTASR